MIREMREEDLAEIGKLEIELFTSPWSEDDFRSELNQNPYARYTVIEKEHEILGYLGLWLVDDKAQVTTFGVKKDAQRQGLARLLYTEALEHFKEKGIRFVSLEVRKSNFAAQCLYQSFGYRILGIRPNYYNDTEDAYLMGMEVDI